MRSCDSKQRTPIRFQFDPACTLEESAEEQTTSYLSEIHRKQFPSSSLLGDTEYLHRDPSSFFIRPPPAGSELGVARIPAMDCVVATGNHPRQLDSVDRHPGHVPFPAAGYRSLHRAFTLVELLVVISIVVLLTGILMPSLSRARAASERMSCASNMRQVGCAVHSYLEDNRDRLPTLSQATGNNPRYSEGMALTTSDGQLCDGLGLLLRCAPLGGHLSDARALYCPCHRGDHPFDRYASRIGGMFLDGDSGEVCYGNYQYRSHRDPATGNLIRDPMRSDRVILTDGLRTRVDFSHITGTNRLFGDTHVDWRADVDRSIVNQIPVASMLVEPPNLYGSIWKVIEGNGMIR
jgi:prepilin-type N-terminal cleavage/methylation domain-containing protein